MKDKACAYCGNSFLPLRPMQSVCSPTCASKKVRADKAVQRKEMQARSRVERARDKQRREALKKRSEWEEECRQIVQKIARLRDRHDGCISCDLPASWDGQWHGSHFRSHGACSVLQFSLWNIHKSCQPCNYRKSGNIAWYRPRLIEKVGAERVDWLECQNGIFKPPIDYYVKFKRVMGKKLRRLERRVELEQGE